MSVLCKEPVGQSFSLDYIPPQSMIKKLDSLNKNNNLHWRLSDEEFYYIQTHYPTYNLIPLVYIIKTDHKFENLSNLPGIIKKLNKGAQKGKIFIYSSLKKSEVNLLKKLGIDYKPVKFLITSS